jgi:hypothetical protein
MMRLRFIYEKRGLLSFVPHVELPPLICRAMRRAGYSIARTMGFSPRDKISLGPALPIGVIGLAEPAEIWLEKQDVPQVEQINRYMPEGLRFHCIKEVDARVPSLNKLCTAAHYRVYFNVENALDKLRSFSVEEWDALGKIEHLVFGNDYIEYVQLDPARAGPTKLVSVLKEKGAVKGWEDLFMVRLAVGVLKGGEVCPPMGPAELDG